MRFNVNKAEIVKEWKPVLETLGFNFRDGMFLYAPTEPGYLDFGISIQRNLHSPSYKFNHTVLFRNPLADSANLEVLLLGHLYKDGIQLHSIPKAVWWTEDRLPDALECLKLHALPWFRKIGRIDYMAEVFERAIQEKTDPIEIIEPIDACTWPSWVKDWLPVQEAGERRLGPIHFYRTAVLHYLKGDRQRTIERTKDWWNSLSPSDVATRKRAQAQLNALTVRKPPGLR